MFFHPPTHPPPQEIYNFYYFLTFLLLFNFFWVFFWGGWVGAPHVHVEQVTTQTGTGPPRGALNERVACFLLSTFNMRMSSLRAPRGGSSVRRRNALHEVGGRSLRATTRVRSASRCETHTHLTFHTFYFLTNNILFSPLTFSNSHKIKS